jgi:hypothetical protein
MPTLKYALAYSLLVPMIMLLGRLVLALCCAVFKADAVLEDCITLNMQRLVGHYAAAA